MKARHLLNLTWVLGAAMLLSACSSQDDKVSFQSGGMTHTFAQGESALSSFPLPIYPKAQASGSVSASGDKDETSKFMMLTSADSLNQVSTFYDKQLKDAGWHVTSSPLGSEMMKFDCTKGGLEASVLLSRHDDQTAISLAVSNEPKNAVQLSGKTFSPDKLNPPTD
jgi:hypothetical protein